MFLVKPLVILKYSLNILTIFWFTLSVQIYFHELKNFANLVFYEFSRIKAFQIFREDLIANLGKIREFSPRENLCT